MSFIGKMFGMDSGAQKESARLQAEKMRQDAENTKRQSEAIANQSAAQARLAQDRARVEEQVRMMQESAEPTQAEVDVGDKGADEPASRRRRAYQNPNAGPSGAVRI